MKRKMMSLLLALAVISGNSVYAKVIDIMSPNGAIKVSVDIKDRIYYSVSYDNNQLLKDCYLNLQLQNETLGDNPRLRSTKRGTIDESVKREIPFKNAIVKNQCNTLRMNFSGNYAVEFRVFDNGMAYRFVTDKKEDNIVSSSKAPARMGCNLFSQKHLWHLAKMVTVASRSLKKLIILPKQPESVHSPGE